MTAMAPMISSRRISRWPIFEVRPSRRFLPVECWISTRPSQAAESRPRLKVVIGDANASTAMAVIGSFPVWSEGSHITWGKPVDRSNRSQNERKMRRVAGPGEFP